MRIFSGVRPSGNIHIGNYLGAIQNWVRLQNQPDNKCVYCVVDWHAITTSYEPDKLADCIYETALAYLAAGIDPENSTFFLQSRVKEHLELAWLLGTLLPVGELTRMTQFKEKSRDDKSPKAGLLNYPVLMAADILLYEADTVPVGEDQIQHVELAREAARRFNNQFGKTFQEPKAIVSKLTARIMSLTDPTKKMSKTGNPKGYLGLFEDEDSLRDKIMSAVTDTGQEIHFDPNRKTGISNLISIYSAFSKQPIEKIEEKFKGENYQAFKKAVADTVIDALEPFREAKKNISREDMKKTLSKGSDQAGQIARKKMAEVREKTGFTF